jgi:hypothetical protein
MATLVELRCEIDARIHRGASFSSIEDDVIDPSDLPEDQKSALWLYGWSFVAPEAQRREARAHIAQLATTESSAGTRRNHLRPVPSPGREARAERAARAHGSDQRPVALKKT